MIRLARFTALASHLGLLALLVAWSTLLAPHPRVPVALMLLVLAGPLLLPLRGLLHARPYTHAWTSFLALYYFVLAVNDVAGDTAPRVLAWTELVLSVTLFGACVAYVRLSARADQRPG